MKRVSLEEQETVITFNRVDDVAKVFTYEPALIRQLTKRGVKPDRIEPEGGHAFTVPKLWVSVRPRRKGQAPSPQAVEALQRARIAQKALCGTTKSADIPSVRYQNPSSIKQSQLSLGER